MRTVRPVPSRYAGFTLVEVLVVVAVMVILAALAVTGLGYMNDAQGRKQAATQLGLLESGLQAYKVDHGGVPANPVSDGTMGTTEIVEALFPGNGEEKVYLNQLDLENDSLKWLTGPNPTKILDPWSNEYLYRSNDPEMPKTVYAANRCFDLWSAGPDGRTATGPNGAYDPNHPDNLDDVRLW